LIHLVLRRRGLAPNFVPPVSLILATAAGHYIAGLVAFRYDDSPEGPAAASAALQWIDVFVNALLRACTDAAAFAEQLELLEQRWRAAAGNPRRNSAADLLLSVLPGLPVLTVDTAARTIGRSTERTNDAVNLLHNSGVLRQGTVGRNRVRSQRGSSLDAITALERKLAPQLLTLPSPSRRTVPTADRRPARVDHPITPSALTARGSFRQCQSLETRWH
jgi:hypothetical protein